MTPRSRRSLPALPAHSARTALTPVVILTLVPAVVLNLVLATAWLAGAAAPPATLTVLAAGDLRGEIEPCGCSPDGQLGGLPRRLTYFAQRLERPGPAPILVDLGNNFPEPTAQGEAKIRLIRKLMGRFPPAAVLPGPGELALGVPALSGRLPYVLSNDAVGEAFAPLRIVERAGARVAIFGYLGPDAVYQGSQSHFRLRPADAALLADWRRRLREARADAALLLFRGSDAELATLAEAGLFDRIVAGNPFADELNQVTARTVAGRRIPQVPTKGQGVLRLSLPLEAGGTAEVNARGSAGAGPAAAAVDWLDGAYADHPAAAPVFATYNEAVAELFFARAKLKERRAEASPYVGAEACRACHQPQHAVWSASRHSRALATLEGVGKEHDPECLACHVAGLERGGFVSADLTPQLAGVQCENCHGPGRAHAAQPTGKPGPGPAAGEAGQARPGEATCRTCHVGSHSPNFDFATYWPKVAHPAPPGAAVSAQR